MVVHDRAYSDDTFTDCVHIDSDDEGVTLTLDVSKPPVDAIKLDLAGVKKLRQALQRYEREAAG